jgi:ATP-dependent helicase/nuclease subunit A
VSSRPADWYEREQALDTTRSWIVEAPAGSGKTGLLIQRYLKLLLDPQVESPAQVIAITFTTKATEEIRNRILSALSSAAHSTEVDSFERTTRELAKQVLARDTDSGWQLLQQPEQLNIRTIDSLAAEIARSMPVLAGGWGKLQPAEDAGPLYARAARRVMLKLGGEDRELHNAIETILLHRDANLAGVEALICGMLQKREQWGSLIPLRGAELTDAFLDEQVLPRLNAALEHNVCVSLTRLQKAFPRASLARVAQIAESLCNEPGYKDKENFLIPCREHLSPPGTECAHLPYWVALIGLLVTKDGWRKSYQSNHVNLVIPKPIQLELKELIDSIRSDELSAAVEDVRSAPPPPYPPEQWVVAKALFRLLRNALGELRLVFAEVGECDFTEVSLSAREALRHGNGKGDLAAMMGMRMQHLLMDEMQDTSASQYDLLEALTAGWDGSSQTLFLVGDPKQSIYLFREAKVELFLRALTTERLGDVPLGRLILTSNFRSQERLVNGFNEIFRVLFPEREGEIVYRDATAEVPALEHELHWHATALPYMDRTQAGDYRKQREREQAEEVASLLHDWRSRPMDVAKSRASSAAVLVRTKTHASLIMEVLAEAGIPYRAVEMERLADRQEVLDVLSLTRALLHPADRTAWLAIFHAPWCGLGLADLHLLAAGDDPSQAQRPLEQMLPERLKLLSEASRIRAEKTWRVLSAALSQRGRMPLVRWVEHTWHLLGGDLCAGPEGSTNVTRFFHLLEKMTARGDEPNLSALQDSLQKLFAEHPASADAVEILTIHKAKGLEWDLVIVPSLEKISQKDDTPLLDWAELPQTNDSGEMAHLLLAPIQSSSGKPASLNDFIRSRRQARGEAELKRLLYVATTRARSALHLFASPSTRKDGIVSARRGTLLHAAWPVAEGVFAQPVNLAPIVPPQASGKVLPWPASEAPPQRVIGLEIAAGAEVAARRPILRRLRADFDPRERLLAMRPESTPGMDLPIIPTFQRSGGSLEVRAVGETVHAFLEEAASRVAEAMTEGVTADQAFERAAGRLTSTTKQMANYARSLGLSPRDAERTAGLALIALESALSSEIGRWLLYPHAGAESEFGLHTAEPDSPGVHIRMDRTFLAGGQPLAKGGSMRWIIDFKSSEHGDADRSYFGVQRAKYLGQMQTYAQAARSAGEKSEIMLGLYFPRMNRLVWWQDRNEEWQIS